MKTRQPLILAAKIPDRDLEPFDVLRKAHFPPDRNVLRAHLTMFHRLPGEYVTRIIDRLAEVAALQKPFQAQVTGLRHLGGGVAFTIASPQLHAIHAQLRSDFASWLGGQDMQKWQPHITVQNKVSKPVADELHGRLVADFRPHSIETAGLDLWRYMDGPWEHEASFEFD
ncbi:2'-5' RNA ligase family protein [Rhizobium sp. Leaf262]|uniref:2'-5' RNA ligase family protein n=1 Tax=Rhizobium sp. Leaf262 TaxID=1736312 RepID=UPI0007157D40|nr:2'-5' RNA ligase family protein [Rhizobium sp. Leaf262]KQO83302.1 hypothetical protein ASF29_00180 [Rhizobium sp. Leaf262]